MDVQPSPIQSTGLQWAAGEFAQTIVPPGESVPALPSEVGITDLFVHPAVTQQLREAGAAPTAATTPPPPASALEVSALRLMLSDPGIQAAMRDFGGDAKPLGGTTVADSIVQRYGPELASQLQQLYTAQRRVQSEYLDALDGAMRAMPSIDPARAKPGDGGPAWQLKGGSFWDDPPYWQFDSQGFTRAYAAGDSPAQQAFATLYGTDALKQVTVGTGETQETILSMAGQRFAAGQPTSADEFVRLPDNWHPSRLEAGSDRLDPNDPPDLYNDDAVWFDPERGWVTDPDNLRPDWLGQALPVVVGVFLAYAGGAVFSAAGTGGGAAAAGAGSSTIGTFAFNTFAAMFNSGAAQLITTGQVDFDGLLSTGLTAGFSAAISDLGSFGDLLGEGSTLSGLMGDGQQLLGVLQDAVGGKGSFGDLLLDAIGSAAGQGILAEIRGGDFGDSFVQSVLNSVAGQVGNHLGTEINANTRLSGSERSMMRLFTTATASALRALGNPNDPSAAFARDFLGSLLNPSQAAR